MLRLGREVEPDTEVEGVLVIGGSYALLSDIILYLCCRIDSVHHRY